MIKQELKDSILEIKDRFIPESEMNFLPKEEVESSLELEIPETVNKMIIENGVSFYLISKVSENTFVKIKAQKASNNLGILKTTLKKISEETKK